jgi:hypothetical protein
LNLPINLPINLEKTNKDFEIFWLDYPRKEAKGAAKKAFEKALKKASMESIMRGVLHCQFNKDPQFIPYPATWLNQERWLDEGTTVDTGYTIPKTNEEVDYKELFK